MKRFRYLSVFLIALVLVGCSKPTPNPRGHWQDRAFATPAAVEQPVREVDNPDTEQRIITKQPNAVVKVFRELFGRTIGRLDFVQKNVIKKTMIPLYKDVLDGNMPYTVDILGDNYVERTVPELSTQYDIFFTFYDHPAFDYPLLILCNQIGNLRLFSIIQFFPDGSYSTFSSLEPGEISIFSTGLFVDSDGNLYIDNESTGEIFEINVVDGILKIDYGYSPDAKGFATLLMSEDISDTPEYYIDPEYTDGTDLFVRTMLVSETLESFDRANYDALKSELRSLELLPYNDANFYKIAGQYADLDVEIDESDDKAHGTDQGFSEEEFRTFIDENLDPYTTKNGTECVFIDDYDNNGKLAAYVVSGQDAESWALFFINEDLVSTPVEKLTKKFFNYRDPKLLKAGKDAYLLLTSNAGGPGMTSYLYGVKDNQVYCPDISGKVAHFNVSGERFSDAETYIEKTDVGGVRKEREVFYDYDQSTRQFVKAKEEQNDAGTGKLALKVNGKDADPVVAVKKDGALCLPVGEFNRQTNRYFDLPGANRSLLDPALADPDMVWAEPTQDGSGDWLFGAFAVDSEYTYWYVDRHKIILSLYETMELDFGSSLDSLSYLQPTPPPFVENGTLYMDVETLSTCFMFSYQYDEKSNMLTVQELDDDSFNGNWKSVSTKGYRDTDELLASEF